jgi:outer membrane protein assembly factor BamD (BamD/ComL family)
MNNLIRFLSIGVIILLLSSCAVNKEYEGAIKTNTISVYENYQKKFPKSKYRFDVDKRLQALYDEQAWKQAFSTNTIYGFKNYLINYPDGNYVRESRIEIEEIEKKNEIDDAWNKSKLDNTIEGYQAFIDLYPTCQYTYEVKSNIRFLQEENAWKVATIENSVNAYAQYLKVYPSGKHSSTANSNIEKLEEVYILPIWNETKMRNTYIAYSDFKNKYPNSSYGLLAEEQMSKLVIEDWDKTCKTNTIKAYEDYISKYPFSDFVKTSEKKIIDLEVDKIFQGSYGHLPPMSKSSSVSASDTSNIKIEIYNNTKYTLTVRYSGLESKKIVIRPKARTKIVLENGKYRIAASVNASNVRNYAGKEDLKGGDYSSEFYIKTETHERSR